MKMRIRPNAKSTFTHPTRRHLLQIMKFQLVVARGVHQESLFLQNEQGHDVQSWTAFIDQGLSYLNSIKMVVIVVLHMSLLVLSVKDCSSLMHQLGVSRSLFGGFTNHLDDGFNDDPTLMWIEVHLALESLKLEQDLNLSSHTISV